MNQGNARLGRPLVPAVTEASSFGIIRGYASLFGSIDLAGDRIEAGAFARSIARRGAAAVRMLWQHDPGRPIGAWTTIAEDAKGLLVEGRLALETIGGREAHGLIKAGAVDGLSIGFRTERALNGAEGPHDRRARTAPRRRLVEIDLWEISVVTFPMQERARVIELRTSDTDLAGRMLAGAACFAAAAGAGRA